MPDTTDQTAPSPTSQAPAAENSLLPAWSSVRDEWMANFPALPEDRVRGTYEGIAHAANWQNRLQNAEENTGSWLYRRILPVGSAQLNFRNAGYVDAARQKIAAGTGTAEDAEVMAVQNRIAESDANASTGQRILGGLASIPAVAGEAFIGGMAGRAVGTAVGLGARAGGAAVAGLESAAPAAEAAGGIMRPALTRFAQGAATSPLMPSLYVERAIQNNREAGRDATAWQGFPAAMTLAAIQNGVFSSVGNLAGSAPTGPGAMDTTRRLFAQTIGAMAVQQGMDIGTSALDDTAHEVFGQSWGLNTRYGIIGSLARGQQGEAMQDAVTQAITMFAFGALHEAANRPPGQPRLPQESTALVPTEQPYIRSSRFTPNESPPGNAPRLTGPSEGPVAGRYRQGIEAVRGFLADMNSQGRTAPEAAAELSRVMDTVQHLVTSAQEQGISRLDARQRIMDALPEGPARDFGLRAVELTAFPERASSGNMRFPLGADSFSPQDATGRLLEGPQGRPPAFLGQNPDLAPRTLSPTATSEVFGQPGGPLHPEGEAVPVARPENAWNHTGTQFRDVANGGVEFTGRNGQPYSLSINRELAPENVRSPENPNQQRVQVRVTDSQGKEAGHVDFYQTKDGHWQGEGLKTTEGKDRRTGVAGAMYDAMAEMGEHVVPNEGQTDAGRAFWQRNRDFGKPKVENPVVQTGQLPNLVIHHGTTHDFEKFDPKYAQRTGLGERGFFFTPDKSLADAFQSATGQGAGPLRTEGKLKKRTVTIEVPQNRLLDLDSPEATKLGKSGNIDAKIKAAGYAGFFTRGGDHVVYDPNEFIVKKPPLLHRMTEKGRSAAGQASVTPTVAPLGKPSLAEIERRVQTGQPVQMSDWFDAAKLTPMERHVMTRMTEDRTVRPTLEEVAAEPQTLKLGMRNEPFTRERMRQIAEKAIGKLGKGNAASKVFSIDEILGKDDASRILDAAEKGGSVDFASLTANPKEVKAELCNRIDRLNAAVAAISSEYAKELDRAIKAGATPQQISELNARIEKEARDAERRLIEAGGAGPRARASKAKAIAPEQVRPQTGFAPAQQAATVASPNPAPAPVPQPAPAARAAAAASNRLAQFISDESGHLDLDITRDFVDQYGIQPATAALSHLNTVWRQLAGEGSPKTTDANAAAGEALERFNGSEVYARFAAPIFAEKVLAGNDSQEFRLKLGGVLTERSLRWTKKAYNEAALKASSELQAAIASRDAAASGERDANQKAAEHRKNGMPKAAEAAEAFARTFAKSRKEADEQAREAAARSNEAIKLRNEVGTIIGQENSPFATVQEYLAARHEPAIDNAIMLHNRFVVPIMDDAFRRSKGMNPTDPINSITQIPGSPVNLKSAKSGDKDVETVIWTKGEGVAGEEGAAGNQRAGRPTNAKLRRNKFSRQRTGASEGYDIDYAKMVEHSLVHQLVNAAKAEAVRTGVDAGIYKWGKPGQSVSFEGENARWGQEFNDVKPPKGTQADLAGETSLYVHPDQAHEFRRAIEIDEPLKFKTIEKFMGAIMAVNLASTAELTYHAKNQLGFLMRVGFNPASLFHDIVGVVNREPKIMDELVELARINTMKSEGFETNNFINQGKYNPLRLGGKLLDLTRKVLLLQGNKAYDRMVKAKLTKGSETGRRNFLNQLGNYNKRSQHKLIKMLRETQIGPFATAGFNYLVQGVRSVLMNPGVKPASMEARLRLRAGMLLRTVAALAVAEIINKAMWGRIDASDDTPLGGMRVGTDANGRAMYIDLMDLIGLKRGLRVMGLLSLLEGKRKNALPEKIIDKSARDIVTALVHPLAGPGAQFALTAAFGVDASGFHVAEHASQLKHESQAMLNAKAAVEHANPAIGTLFGNSQKNKTGGQRAMELAGPFGIRTAPPPRLR